MAEIIAFFSLVLQPCQKQKESKQNFEEQQAMRCACLLVFLFVWTAVVRLCAANQESALFNAFFPSPQVTEAEFFSTIYQRHTHVDRVSNNSDGSALAHFNALIGGGNDVLMLADVDMLCNTFVDLGAPSSALKVCVCVCVCMGGWSSVV